MSSHHSNSIGTRVLKAIAVAVMTFMMVAGGATAAQAATSGDVATVNSVTTVNTTSTDDVSIQTCVGAGGGIHCYGSTTLSNGNKRCYSDYRHDTKYHGAKVVGGGKEATTYQNAGIWAKAFIDVPAGASCAFAYAV